MSRSSRRGRAALLTATCSVVLALGVAPAQATSSACTSATAATWVGGLTGSWTDPLNWSSGEAPGAAANVTVAQAGTLVSDVAGQVCDLTVQGGTDADQLVTLDGSLEVLGDASVGGRVRLGAAAAPATVTVRGLLTTASATLLDLLSGTQLDAPGGVQTGQGTALTTSAGAAEGAPRLAAPLLTLTGDTTLTGVGLAVPASGTVDVNGQHLTLSGAAVTLTGPVTLKGLASGATGTLELGSGTTTALSGTATLDGNVLLRLSTGSALTGDAATLQSLSAGASVAWDAGTLSGAVALDSPVSTDGTGVRTVAAGAVVTVPIARQLVVSGGTLVVEGELLNRGTTRLVPGTSLVSTGTGTSRLTNDSGDPNVAAVLAVGLSDTTAGSGNVGVRDVALRNAGLISLASGTRLVVSGDLPTPTAVQLLSGSKLRDPVPVPESGTPPTAGVLQIGSGAAATLTGTPLVESRAVLLLDDGSDGTRGSLTGAGATLSSTGATAGTFRWRSGTVTGPLTVDKVATDLGANSEAGRRFLQPAPSSTAPTLTIAGPGALSRAFVTLAPQATVLVTSPVATPFTIGGGPGGFVRSGTAVEGQSVTIGGGGRLDRSGAYATENSNGSTSAPATIDVPVVNRGQLLLGASLDLPAGYTQDQEEGKPVPVTGLLQPDSQGGSGRVVLQVGQVVSGVGSFAAATINAGRLAGDGIVRANPLTVAAAQVDPGFVNTQTQVQTVGTLTVQGDLHLGPTSDVQVFLTDPASEPTTAAKHDVLEVVPLTYKDAANADVAVAPGKAYLDGRMTGLTSSAWNPPYGTVVQNLVTYPARVGAFATFAWSGLPSGLGWRPAYDDVPAAASTTDADTDGLATDLRVDDVAAPALGLAGIPAFTQQSSQRITYAAVDNKTGVKSYDVRWRRGSAATGYGGWNYPAAWQATRATSVTQSIGGAYSYCWSVRVRDNAGNTSAWSQPLCTTRMTDDRSLSAAGSWVRPAGQPGFYNGTFSRSSQAGARLSTSGTFTRVAVTAYKCPSCGTIEVWAGTRMLRRLSLASSTTGLTSYVSPVLAAHRMTLTVKVVSSGRPVAIDAVGMTPPA